MSDCSWEASSVSCPCPQLLTAMANLGFEMDMQILAFLGIFTGPKLKLMLFFNAPYQREDVL